MAFLGSAAIWWLYFTSVSTIGEHYLGVSQNRTILARDAYTYLHVVFVAGIILSAVGDELVIAHPTEILPSYEVAAVAAGPARSPFVPPLFLFRLPGGVFTYKPFRAPALVRLGLV